IRRSLPCKRFRGGSLMNVNSRTVGIVAIFLGLAAQGCSTLSAGSLFSPLGFLSLIPGPQGPPGHDGQDGHDGQNGANGQNGQDGQNGQPGADGSLRIYGDGSLGDVQVSANQTLADIATNGNTQFRNLVITSLGTLTVPSGTVLH